MGRQVPPSASPTVTSVEPDEQRLPLPGRIEKVRDQRVEPSADPLKRARLIPNLWIDVGLRQHCGGNAGCQRVEAGGGQRLTGDLYPLRREVSRRPVTPVDVLVVGEPPLAVHDIDGKPRPPEDKRDRLPRLV